MGLGLLLIPSLGGYWFLRRANFTRFEIYRLSGYHLLFRSALAGIILASFAHPIALFIDALVPQLRSFWYAYISVNYVDTAILSILLAAIIPPVINRFHSEERAAKRTSENYGDLIELMIARAFEQIKLIELSLKNRKSYIGFVLWRSITKRGQSDVTLVPVVSGYRFEDTLELCITTNYAPIIYKWIKEKPKKLSDFRDFNVVIPRSEVSSARIFDPEAYRLFQQSVNDERCVRYSATTVVVSPAAKAFM